MKRLHSKAFRTGCSRALLFGALAMWQANAQPAADQRPRVEYQIDLDALNRVFGRLPSSLTLTPDKPATFDTPGSAGPVGFPNRITKVEEAFMVQMRLGEGKSFDARTHLFGDKVNIIPYGDGDEVPDAAGRTHRGDEVVAHYFPPGEIGYAIKHHRPMYRVLGGTTEVAPKEAKEEIKLQDTHIEIVMGVRRNGRPGVITVNNPQNYQEGGFGDDSRVGDYPMIFVKPAFPNYLPAEVRALLVENIRTMAVGFNTVSRFPDDYNGGDPLSAYNLAKVREFVKMMVKAVAGDAEAREFFYRKENYMYCAELAFVSTSAGLLVPLNRENILKLGVTEHEWAAFKREVALHNQQDAARPSFFVEHNANERIHLIPLADLEKLDSLKPLPEYSGGRTGESEKLMFKPLTMADIVEGFMRLYFPREEQGEQIAPYQAKVLALMKPGLLEMMAVDPASPEGKAAGRLFDEMIAAVGKQYPSYQAFRKELAPLLQKARTMTGPRDGGGEGLFTPPSLFHLVLKGINADAGLISLQYVGHGLHFATVKPK
jgi:hypothetical protein